jgi:hypothetical protein
MKLYLRDLIPVTTPTENIVALDALRRKYGEHQRDARGAYYDIGPEDLRVLPAGITVGAVPEAGQV